MRENAFCMVFHVRWISHHSSPNLRDSGGDSETRGEKNPSHMENHTKCISCHKDYYSTRHIGMFTYIDTLNCIQVPAWFRLWYGHQLRWYHISCSKVTFQIIHIRHCYMAFIYRFYWYLWQTCTTCTLRLKCRGPNAMRSTLPQRLHKF